MRSLPYCYFEPEQAARLGSLQRVARTLVDGFISGLYRDRPAWDNLLVVVLVLVAAEAMLANWYHPMRRQRNQVRDVAFGADA
jgi:hypothetical protein